VEGGMVWASGLGEGVLVARLGEARGEARVEGVMGQVEGLRVRPASVLRGAGQRQRLQAFGRFEGGPEIELTQAVAWEGAPGGALEVAASGEVVARLGAASVRVPVVVAGQALERMTPERERLVLPLGTRLPVEVLGSYGADGVVSVREQAAWRSLDEDVVGVVAGVVEGRRAGEAEVVAELEGQQARVRVEVVERAGQGVAITPGDGVMELGAEGQFSASALFEDGSSAYVTREGVWTSSDPAVLAVGNGERLGGQVTALGLGRSVLTVRFGQAVGELEVEVIPAR
jgi:trimeric autotransporter adhesin